MRGVGEKKCGGSAEEKAVIQLILKHKQRNRNNKKRKENNKRKEKRTQKKHQPQFVQIKKHLQTVQINVS